MLVSDEPYSLSIEFKWQQLAEEKMAKFEFGKPTFWEALARPSRGSRGRKRGQLLTQLTSLKIWDFLWKS